MNDARTGRLTLQLSEGLVIMRHAALLWKLLKSASLVLASSKLVSQAASKNRTLISRVSSGSLDSSCLMCPCVLASIHVLMTTAPCSGKTSA